MFIFHRGPESNMTSVNSAHQRNPSVTFTRQIVMCHLYHFVWYFYFKLFVNVGFMNVLDLMEEIENF